MLKRGKGLIVKRSIFKPTSRNGMWDALVRIFETMPQGDVLGVLGHESLYQVLEDIKRGRVAEEDFLGLLEQQAAVLEFERSRVRRKVVDRIALRDQPILDKFQGEVSRLPLDRQVMLFGPPGSGKTTTLIKRLAQKRTPSVEEDEERLVTDYIRDNLFRIDGWAMFSPTELLKKYLGEAFNQEGVPDADNVRTWEKERQGLARNVFGILRSATSGRFQLDGATSGLLADPSSRGIANLHDDFSAYAETNLLNRFNEALDSLQESEDERINKAVSNLRLTLEDGRRFGILDVLKLLDETEALQSEVKRIGERVSNNIRKIFNGLLKANRSLLDEIVEALPAIKEQEVEETEEDVDETTEIAPTPAIARWEASNLLKKALRVWARAIAEGRRSIGGQSGRVLDLVGNRLPPESEFVDVGASIVTRSQLRTLLQAPRTFVLGIPVLYGSFRRQSVRKGRHFVTGEATTTFLARNKLTPDEVDVVLLVMLRNARALLQFFDGRRLENVTPQDWLESIKSRYFMQVFVDEATDFSAVQLACMIELSNPRLRSWFACGDFRQRVTLNGIRNRAEIDWLNRITGVRIDIKEIEIGYRQSQRLPDLADALSALDEDGAVVTKPPRGSEEADVWPLLGERLSGDTLSEWLAERICEVERAIGRLPSIAVFVAGDDLIDPLVKDAQSILERLNIRIVGCKEGRVVGDGSEVRVFDVQHIKGLEFEAVFL